MCALVSVWLFATPRTVAHQASLSMGFSRQEYWSGSPCPSPEGIQASLVAATVKHLPAMQETRVWSLSQDNPLEKEMATHSSTLAWKIPWMEEPGGLQSMGSQRGGHDRATSLLLQRNFPTQGSNPGLLHHRQVLYHLSYSCWNLGNRKRVNMENGS